MYSIKHERPSGPDQTGAQWRRALPVSSALFHPRRPVRRQRPAACILVHGCRQTARRHAMCKGAACMTAPANAPRALAPRALALRAPLSPDHVLEPEDILDAKQALGRPGYYRTADGTEVGSAACGERVWQVG